MAIIGENFPQSREARKVELQRIKDGAHVSTVKIPGRGVSNVYRIPLEFLSYNPHNTRFLAEAKTLEKKLGRKLSDESPDDVGEIEHFLWKQNEDQNENTINSLIKETQLQPGVVTLDGVILSGNRRFRLLNEIARNRNRYSKDGVNLDGLQYFEAAILDDQLTEKDIVRYESYYQYGTENKVEYDPIQKYIAAHDQHKLGFTDKEIAENFMSITEGGKERKVKEWLEVFRLMDEYLEYIGEPGIYTALEGREEAFLNLRRTLNGFQNGRSGSGIWAFEEFDLDNLKLCYFQFIRLNVGTHDFRLFKDIFSKQDRWEVFSENSQRVIDENPLKSFDEYRREYEELDEAEVAKMRNRDYEAKVGKELKQLYGSENARITAEKVGETPMKTLEQIQQKLEKLESELTNNPDNETFDTAEFVDTIRDILSRVGKIKQQVD